MDFSRVILTPSHTLLWGEQVGVFGQQLKSRLAARGVLANGRWKGRTPSGPFTPDEVKSDRVIAHCTARYRRSTHI